MGQCDARPHVAWACLVAVFGARRVDQLVCAPAARLRWRVRKRGGPNTRRAFARAAAARPARGASPAS
eukprot:6789640-Prymnesium_polylepis.1